MAKFTIQFCYYKLAFTVCVIKITCIIDHSFIRKISPSSQFFCTRLSQNENHILFFSLYKNNVSEFAGKVGLYCERVGADRRQESLAR